MIILGPKMSKRSLESPPRLAWNYPAPRSGAGHRRGSGFFVGYTHAIYVSHTHIYMYVCIHIYIYYRKAHDIIVDCRFNYYIYICVWGSYKDVTNLIGNTYNVMHRDMDVTPLCKWTSRLCQVLNHIRCCSCHLCEALQNNSEKPWGTTSWKAQCAWESWGLTWIYWTLQIPSGNLT